MARHKISCGAMVSGGICTCGASTSMRILTVSFKLNPTRKTHEVVEAIAEALNLQVGTQPDDTKETETVEAITTEII